MTISGTIPNLIGGISQQPGPVRLENTADDALNVTASVTTGLKKRPPLRAVGQLLSTTPANGLAYYAWERGGDLNRHVVIANGTLKVFTEAGVEETVTFPDGVTYLGNGDPEGVYKFLPVGDWLFVLNTNRPVGTSIPTETRVDPLLYRTFVVTAAVANTRYRAIINGAPFDHTTGASPGSASEIAEALRVVIAVSHPGVVRNDNVLTVPVDSTTIEAQGTSPILKVIYDTVDRFTDLPQIEIDGRILRVRPDPADGAAAPYYVKFDYTKRLWEEVLGFNQGAAFVASDLPLALQPNGGSTWACKKMTWAARTTGDDTTNPWPSFAGAAISDMFLWQNRLCFLTGENLVRSEIGHYQNFFRTTTAQLLQSDRDDIALPSTTGKLVNFKYAAPFNNRLALFSDGVQFNISTASDGSGDYVATENTFFKASPTCAPVSVGRNFLFADADGDTAWSSIREFFVDGSGEETTDSVTRHVPELVPNGVHRIVANPTIDAAFAFTRGNNRSRLYVYTYFWGARERIQSAWWPWEFEGVSKVFTGGFLGDRLYLVYEYDGRLFLGYISPEDTLSGDFGGVEITLDQRISTPTARVGFFASGTSQVLVPLDLKYDTTTPLLVVTTAASSFGPAGTVVTGASFAGQVDYTGGPNVGTWGLVNVPGDLTGVSFVIGHPYEGYWKFSPIYNRDPDGLPILDGEPQVTYLKLAYHNATQFEVEVVNHGGAASHTKQFTSIVPGQDVTAETGVFRTAVRSSGHDLDATLRLTGPFNARFSSVEWEGKWRPRTRRMR